MRKFAMLKFKIAAGLFAFSIICLFLYSTFSRTLDDSKQFGLLLLASGPLAYIVIFIIYVIAVKKFRDLKDLFYDVPLEIIRKSIHGSKNLFFDGLMFYITGAILNFVSIYFLAYTPISDVLSHITGSLGFENIPQLNSPLFDLNNLRARGNTILVLPYMAIGPAILFILRRIRHRTYNIAKSSYPGSRAILVFIISMIVIYLIQYQIEFEKSGSIEVIFQMTLFYSVTIWAFGLSFFNFIVAAVFVISDRFLFSKLQAELEAEK